MWTLSSVNVRAGAAVVALSSLSLRRDDVSCSTTLSSSGRLTKQTRCQGRCTRWAEKVQAILRRGVAVQCEQEPNATDASETLRGVVLPQSILTLSEWWPHRDFDRLTEVDRLRSRNTSFTTKTETAETLTSFGRSPATLVRRQSNLPPPPQEILYSRGDISQRERHRQSSIIEFRNVEVGETVRYEPIVRDPRVSFHYPSKRLPSFENLLLRSAYLTSVNFRFRVPNWVAERVTSRNYDGPADRKKSFFSRDPSVPAMFSPDPREFLRTGWSRGHLAPAGAHKNAQSDMDETFLVAGNIVPQELSSNGCDWRRLEVLTKNLAHLYEEVYVCSGPLWMPQASVSPLLFPYSWLADSTADETGKVGTSSGEVTESPSPLSTVDSTASTSSSDSDRGDVGRHKRPTSSSLVTFPVIGYHGIAAPTHLFKVVVVARPVSLDVLAERVKKGGEESGLGEDKEAKTEKSSRAVQRVLRRLQSLPEIGEADDLPFLPSWLRPYRVTLSAKGVEASSISNPALGGSTGCTTLTQSIESAKKQLFPSQAVPLFFGSPQKESNETLPYVAIAAFIVPNRAICKQLPLWQFQVPLQTIEFYSGLNFEGLREFIRETLRNSVSADARPCTTKSLEDARDISLVASGSDASSQREGDVWWLVDLCRRRLGGLEEELCNVPMDFFMHGYRALGKLKTAKSLEELEQHWRAIHDDGLEDSNSFLKMEYQRQKRRLPSQE